VSILVASSMWPYIALSQVVDLSPKAGRDLRGQREAPRAKGGRSFSRVFSPR